MNGAPGGVGWSDLCVGLVGVLVEGDEGPGGVEGGLEGLVPMTETVVVGAVDDVLVGDGCGAGVVSGYEAEGRQGEFEVTLLLRGVFALGNG
jgi:hypothetical protein